MCTVRRSHTFRPFAWLATVLAVFVFALAPAGWAAIEHIDFGGDLEGDPGDGHNFTGGGGTFIDDGSKQDSAEYGIVEQPSRLGTIFPLVMFEGNRIHITFVRIELISARERVEGGKQ